MARAAMVVTAMTGSYDSDGVVITGGFASFNDTDNEEIVAFSGGEILLFTASSGTPTVTIKSVNDPFSRTGDLVKVLSTTDVVIFGPMETTGFKQTGGQLFVDGSAAGITYMILKP